MVARGDRWPSGRRDGLRRGAAWRGWGRSSHSRRWFLSYLFVDPERWGEGIGGAILDAVLAEAKRRTCSRMHLWTHDDNERSHRLYRSRGFSPTGQTAGGESEWARDQLDQ